MTDTDDRLIAAAASIGAPLWLTGTFSWWSIPAAAAALAAGFLAFPRHLQLSLSRIASAAVCAGIAYALLFGVIAPSLTPLWISPRVAAAVRADRPCDTTVLASSGFEEPSLVFLVGTDTVLTTVDGVANHLLRDPSCAMGLVMVQQETRLQNMLAAQGKSANRVAEIDGINYSSGQHVSLGLYRLTR